MKTYALMLCLAMAAIIGRPAHAVDPADAPLQIVDASDIDLDDLKWTYRVMLVFADSERDPRFVSQLDMIAGDPNALITRDVVVVTDTDPDAKTEIRQKYRSQGFSLIILAKDGTINLRKPRPWPIRDISASIDKLPLRQQEIRERR